MFTNVEKNKFAFKKFFLGVYSFLSEDKKQYFALSIFTYSLKKSIQLFKSLETFLLLSFEVEVSAQNLF